MGCPRCGGQVALSGGIPPLASCPACSLTLLTDPLRELPECNACSKQLSVVTGKLPITAKCDGCSLCWYVLGPLTYPAPPVAFPVKPDSCPQCSAFLSLPTEAPPVGRCTLCECDYLLDPVRLVPPCLGCSSPTTVQPGVMPVAVKCSQCGRVDQLGLPNRSPAERACVSLIMVVVGSFVVLLIGGMAAYWLFARGDELARHAVADESTTFSFTATEVDVELWAEVDAALPFKYDTEEENGWDTIPPLLRYEIRVEQGGKKIRELSCDPFDRDRGDWIRISDGDGEYDSRLRFDVRMRSCRFRAAAGEPLTIHVHRVWVKRDWARIDKTELIARTPNKMF
jgi:hypothetical protein